MTAGADRHRLLGVCVLCCRTSRRHTHTLISQTVRGSPRSCLKFKPIKFSCWCLQQQRQQLRGQPSGVCVKLQALVFDILPSWRVPESDARSVRLCVCVCVCVFLFVCCCFFGGAGRGRNLIKHGRDHSDFFLFLCRQPSPPPPAPSLPPSTPPLLPPLTPAPPLVTIRTVMPVYPLQ